MRDGGRDHVTGSVTVATRTGASIGSYLVSATPVVSSDVLQVVLPLRG